MQTKKLNCKPLAFTGLFLIIATVFISFKIKHAADDFWEKLGMTQVKGDENIKASFLNGYFSYYGAKAAKNIVLNERAAVAKDLMSYSKQLVNSETFRKDYEKMRTRYKPTEHPYTPKTKEEVRKQKIAEMQKAITDAEALVKKMPEMEKNMRPTIDMFKKNLKDYEKPESEMIEMFYQNELNTKAQREKTYQDHLKRWQKDFPENLNVLIKERLQKFVTVAKTVDFNAELKEVGGKKKFVNSKYEYESTECKQIFRAGKEVIQPAIVFAEQWIRELN